MIRKVAGWCLDRLIHWMEGKNKPVDARLFVEEHYPRFLNDASLTPEVQSSLCELESLMLKMGWLRKTSFSDGTEKQAYQIDDDWLEKFKARQVFNRGILEAGTGKYLDCLDEIASPENKTLISAALEDLLRHAEVKREQSFAKFTSPLSNEQIELERHDISILFCRAARRRGDLRFLNTALKMNEWRMQKRIHERSKENTARYMLALAEQELAVQELLA